MRLILLLIVILLGSCRGELVGSDGDPPDVGDVSDAGMPEDTAPEADMPADPECQGVSCGANAVCVGGGCYCSPGFMGDAMAGCVEGNPCASVECGFGSTCDDDGECPCDPGFVETAAGACELPEELFPAERTEQEVCDRWNADYPETAAMQWQVEPAEQCEPGILEPAYQLDAIRRVSLYRWLSGLLPVTSNRDYMGVTQACATALAAEDVGLQSQIDTSWTCYSEDADSGVNASNITNGATTAAGSVDQYMADEGVDSLGHRRWILFPELGATAFGIRGKYSCMYTFDRSASAAPQFVAYPFATFPMAALMGAWSWSSDTLGFDESATVTITDSGGGDVTVENVRVAVGNFGWPTLAWDVPDAAAGQTYSVTIGGLSGEVMEVSYGVSLVACP